MYVLGISCYYHDSSATLVKDGRVVAAAEEERFTRIKHDSSFPANAIGYCLDSQNIEMKDIGQMAYYEKPFLKFERILYQHLHSFPSSLNTFIASIPDWMSRKLRIVKKVRKLGYKKDILFIPHHMAHAASAFLVSPYEKAAILTIDGVGEWTTAAFGTGDGIGIHLLKELKFPHSIGLLYSTITAYLGFSVNNSEYKVMGLAAYGKHDRKKNIYYNRLLKTIDLRDDGSFHFDLGYYSFHYKNRMPSKKMCALLGGPVTRRDSGMTARHKDIAAACQMLTEDIIQRMLLHLHKETLLDNLVLAGGCALNSVSNGKILANTPFKRLWIQPNATDGGTSLGAAIYAYNTILGKKRNYVMKHAYLGPGHSTNEIRDFLVGSKIQFTEFSSSAELIHTTARLINDNQVVGWFQGRMEWGPRALGSRSILANPCNKNARDLLNLKVKHRERFRPFAPVVCEDDALTYFECDKPVPEPTDFMLMVYPVRKRWHKKIPSVIHVDGSGRLQTVRRRQNQIYYDVIKEFGRLSGIPILINTSFNIRGEPIVCSPYDAYRCMMGTGIDCLVMDKFLIYRDDNPYDMWNSESLADD